MNTTTDTPGAFNPVAAQPVGRTQPDAGPKPKRKRTAKAAGKANAKRPKRGADKPAPTRRTAPITVDLSVAFACMASAKKKDVAAIKAIVDMLNPMARASRLRVMQAVTTILN